METFEVQLCEGRSPTFLEEDRTFFVSLYGQLDVARATPTTSFFPFRDLRFIVGEEKLDTHSCIMTHFCPELVHVLVKTEEGVEGEGVTFVTVVPDSLGVSPEAFKLFRKAIYLKELQPTTYELWTQVRRLAEHLNCGMVLRKCDDIRIKSSNCHVVFDKWPQGCEVKKKALDFMKRNLKKLVDTEACLAWSQALWMDLLALNDLPPPVPTEDELFSVLLKWQSKSKDRVDEARFRTDFKPLFRYHLMTEGNLFSKTFQESGILDRDDIWRVLTERNNGDGTTVTTFNKTPRSAASLSLRSAPQAEHLPQDEDEVNANGRNKVIGLKTNSSRVPKAKDKEYFNKDELTSSRTSVKRVEQVRKSDLTGDRDLKHVPKEFLPRFLQLLNAGRPPPRNLSKLTWKHRTNGGRTWPGALQRMDDGQYSWEKRASDPCLVKGSSRHCTFGNCGKSFPSPRERIEHERVVHKGLTSMRCYFCAKLFNQINHVERHVACHTQERPFFCPSATCGKEYRSSYNLKRHVISNGCTTDTKEPSSNS